jgi:NAD(P)-dependent dehydrogenase (short-subunit alcohol dehydrogenase family)
MATLNFNDSTILVTGGSRGLGLALVKTLASKPVNCVYAGCKSQEGVDYITSLALPKVQPILLNVTDDEHIAKITNTVSTLDVVINNAGTASACGYSSENALSIAKAEMDVHYFGALSLIQKLLPLLKGSNKAGIINVASIAGISNFKGMGTYSASKAALHFMTQGLRAELAEFNIFVQGVYPGPFDTRLAAGYDGPKHSPETIANTILNLFTDRVGEVFPDDFSQTMYQTFLESPKKLDEIFSQ